MRDFAAARLRGHDATMAEQFALSGEVERFKKRTHTPLDVRAWTQPEVMDLESVQGTGKYSAQFIVTLNVYVAGRLFRVDETTGEPDWRAIECEIRM